MPRGASDQEISAAEHRLGVTFPPELRALVAHQDGSEEWFGDTFVLMYSVAAMVDVNGEVDGHPGLLIFGSDGSRELIGLDLRVANHPVVMIDVTSRGWDEALLQAPSLHEFMAQRLRGEPLRWEDRYPGV